MKKFILLLFASFLFASVCNKSSINSAYKDYYKFQQQYISAILDNDKQNEIKALKGLVECGEFLKFNVSDYKQKLSKLTKKQKLKTKINTSKAKPDITPSNKHEKFSKYIKIYSYNPLKLKIPNNNIRFFTIKTKIYKKIIDLPNAIIHKAISKKLNNGIYLKIAQFNKKTVRIVYYSKNKFTIRYTLKNHILTITVNSPKKHTIKSVLAQKPKAYKPKSKVIVIDPGHGGKDAGGVGIKNRYEKIAVLQISKYLKNYLTKKGYTVYLTRNSDYFIPLKKRTHFANLKKADLFISIHCNIAPKHNRRIHGIETYFLSPTRNERAIAVARLENKEIKGLNYLDQRVILNFLNRDRMIDSNKLAIDIQQGMLSSLKTKYNYVRDNGVRPAPFWVLVGTQMPAILIETGYLTNPIESSRLFTSKYQRLLAKGIAEGIENYFRKNP
ncbi:N-acetylmuramoyl-L-alanine amidase [Nautilia profundicola AmH]|uniref:N-acetylmuramoyl-L-alanine amidase n=1 Tax=Nautilia profundicola (strain ATCC BAA-1463 / DSM 18972 / AmH) TaxID=598659 RepID=B9L8G9_NAUPA|nr:N-acetylmuramoyl-L-alanine amidase [Nautilia profundicola]ACM92958.1 N-acetylmuramoyl-L-alanine amidase [Nautilia profundicola AmH]